MLKSELEAQRTRDARRIRDLEKHIEALDPEAKAVNSINKAIDRLPKRDTGGYRSSGGNDTGAIKRVLTLAAVRAGLPSPTFAPPEPQPNAWDDEPVEVEETPHNVHIHFEGLFK